MKSVVHTDKDVKVAECYGRKVSRLVLLLELMRWGACDRAKTECSAQ